MSGKHSFKEYNRKNSLIFLSVDLTYTWKNYKIIVNWVEKSKMSQWKVGYYYCLIEKEK